MKIDFFGDILGQSGYHRHARELVNAMYRLDPTIHLTTNLPQGWEQSVNDEELKMIHNNADCDVSIMVGQPHFWKQYYNRNPKRKFVGFVVWEGDKVPPYWIECMKDSKVSQIWVPSSHVQKAIASTTEDQDILGKIRMVPHGVNLSLFRPIQTQRDAQFTFIVNKGWARGLQDRGGVQWAIKAFNNEFRKDEQVQLMVKINTVYCPQGWNLREEIKKLEIQESAKMIFNVEAVQDALLPSFYAKADCFVSPTMSEAFNLPGLEAMACSLPTIQTGFGGQTDYMTEENSWKIDYDLVDSPEKPAYEGVKWAMPKIEHLQKLMRFAFERPDETRRKGRKALEDSQKWSWDQSAKKAMDILQDI